MSENNDSKIVPLLAGAPVPVPPTTPAEMAEAIKQVARLRLTYWEQQAELAEEQGDDERTDWCGRLAAEMRHVLLRINEIEMGQKEFAFHGDFRGGGC